MYNVHVVVYSVIFYTMLTHTIDCHVEFAINFIATSPPPHFENALATCGVCVCVCVCVCV